MPPCIKNPGADRLGREAGNSTDETLTAPNVRRPEGLQLADDLLAIGTRCAALPVLDSRRAEQILGYDQHALLG